MWQIIKNEWHSGIRNRILQSTSLGFVSVLLLSVYLGNLQTQQQNQRYHIAKEHLRNQWENNREMHPHGAVHYGTYLFKPTNLLSSLEEGVNSVTGNVLRVEGHIQNEIVHSEASQIQAISRFGKLKSSLLLQYMIPLLLIFLAYQSINSEKQSGRLRLLLVQGADPTQLILGKTLAVCSYGIGLLGLSILVYASIRINEINIDLAVRLILFFLSYSLYYLVLSGLTIYLAIVWKNTSLALISMVGLWIIWTIFSPSILMSSIEQWHPLPGRIAFKEAMKEDRAKGISGHGPADERRKELEKKVLAEYGVDSLSQLPVDFWGILMQEDEEYGNMVWDKHFGQLREVLARQKYTYQLGGILNPFIPLHNLSMGLAGNDNFHHQEFLVQAEEYRRVFIKRLNDKHAYGGTKTGDWDLKIGSDFYKSVAEFTYHPPKLHTIFPKYVPDLLLLGAWSLLAISLLIFGTKKIQVL